MPYARCEHCGLRTLTVAGWSHVDHCARCGAELPHAATLTGGRFATAPTTERSSHGPPSTTP